MICPKCDSDMESMGYGDLLCPNCNHAEYAEAEDDFLARIADNSKNEAYLKECLAEYKKLHFADMTLGERYSAEGQAKLDREAKLLTILSNAACVPPYEFVQQVKMGLR